MEIQAVVGKNVRRYRELKGISQEELGAQSNLHRTYVSGVERGIRNPTVEIIKKLADALGVEPNELLEAPIGR